MCRLWLLTYEHRQLEKLSSQLAQKGLDCSILNIKEATPEKLTEQMPDLVLLAIEGLEVKLGVDYLAWMTSQHKHPPIIVLLSAETLNSLDHTLPIDDFVIKPWDATEVELRVKRILRRTKGIGRGKSIECGDLVLDLDNCEVTVDGRLINLTFKEYELLKFLASNKGRVFSRETLLNNIWGYDYYGGDRTVDVHIRRLRSKIEGSTHTFVETVRNIGYKFKKNT